MLTHAGNLKPAEGTVLETHETSASAETARRRPPHALSAHEVIDHFATHGTHGLTGDQVSQRKVLHGRNVLAEAPPPAWWRRLAAQFMDVMIGVLVAAAVVSAVTGDLLDAIVILAVVVLNGLLGFFQEERAGRALAVLRKLSSPQAKVIRDGELKVVPAHDLVPGDRVELEAGDHVPADARLIHSAALRVQEAALTGESVPVSKDHRAVHEEHAQVADRSNVAHMGTVVAAGKGSGVVVATGMTTQLGQVAGLLAQQRPEPTPLQRRLAGLGRAPVVASLVIVAIIFALHMIRGGRAAEVAVTALSLAVAAVPEGLPAVVTIALALGLQRMARRHALIRRLPSVEALGSVTVICSDKTGTLTRNEMTVREVHAGGVRYDVSGGGYDPHGQFLHDSVPVSPADTPDLLLALTAGARCSHVQVSRRPDGDGWTVIGDPTEAALLVAARKAGLPDMDAAHQLLEEIPFDSDRKAMSVIFAPVAESDPIVMYTKGAPEVVLGWCTSERFGNAVRPLTEDRRREILRAGEDMAGRALRVLALAYREAPLRSAGSDDFAEAMLIFVGLVGMLDPPREEAADAVRRCHRAGVRPIMITGDHPSTALAVAAEVGIASSDLSSPDAVLTGVQLDKLADDELAALAGRVSIYARVTAEHKLRVVRALRESGQIVAMTGDGVNDAPAIQAADVGIAMGRTGTDVTREASDMVLTDDNFASIVNAVEEGRGIFENILKVVQYLLASNASELLLMLFAAFAGWPVPLLAIHILWINLVTDTLPALGLATERPERDVMNRPPRPPDEPVLTPRRWRRVAVHAALIASVALAAFALVYDGQAENLARARTAAFCVLVFSQLAYAFACRSVIDPILRLGWRTNSRLLAGVAIALLLQLCVVLLPLAQPVFRTSPDLGVSGWLLVLGLSLAPAMIIELAKVFRPSRRV